MLQETKKKINETYWFMKAPLTVYARGFIVLPVLSYYSAMGPFTRFFVMIVLIHWFLAPVIDALINVFLNKKKSWIG